jgi:rubrerythrin
LRPRSAAQDTHDLLEELEARLNRKIRENSDSIHEMHEDFTDVCSKLVKKFTEENLTRDERIEEHHKLFSDLFGKLERCVRGWARVELAPYSCSPPQMPARARRCADLTRVPVC